MIATIGPYHGCFLEHQTTGSHDLWEIVSSPMVKLFTLHDDSKCNFLKNVS